MNNQWLETFICVSQTQSIGKAADILFISTPTVSSRLQSLEQELGEPLFLRVGKKLILNESGRTFLPYAVRIVGEWNRSKEAITELKQAVRGTLTIALFYAVIPLFTPGFISFNKKYPDVRLSFKTMHSDEIAGYVQANIAQVGIVRKTDDPLFSVATLLVDQFVLIVYPGHPFSIAGTFQIEELGKEKIIFLNSGPVYKEVIGNFIDPKQLETCIWTETDNVDICKQYIQARQGIAFMPRFAVRQELEEGSLVALKLDLENHVQRSVDLIWMKQHSNYLVQVFVDHVQQHFLQNNI